MENKLGELLRQSTDIVFFGGAGTSTESGIPDFRSEGGLYRISEKQQLPPETILSHSFFMRYPEHFYTFYKSHMIHLEAKPGAAHLALSSLESQGKLNTVITQNIDGLHQMAGSRNVLELHGSIHRNSCMKCHASYPLQAILESSEKVPRCDICGEVIKPDVILYEESLDPNIIELSVRAVERASVLIVGGTSLTVNPAASLINYFRGDKLVLINKTPTPYDSYADLLLCGSIGEILSAAMISDALK
ncbi:MAG: NAD-dependent protein deacylase [Gorillibacterium sp.]|nr:NAD-dependent protein deacylase [Gorillibacterium sp.]